MQQLYLPTKAMIKLAKIVRITFCVALVSNQKVTITRGMLNEEGLLHWQKNRQIHQ